MQNMDSCTVTFQHYWNIIEEILYTPDYPENPSFTI